jgi:hypothetical protein
MTVDVIQTFIRISSTPLVDPVCTLQFPHICNSHFHAAVYEAFDRLQLLPDHRRPPTTRTAAMKMPDLAIRLA